MGNPSCKVLGQTFTEQTNQKNDWQSSGLTLTHTIASLLGSEHMSLLLGAGFSIGFNPESPVSLSCKGKTLPSWCGNNLKSNSIIENWLSSISDGDSVEQLIQHIEVATEFYKDNQVEREKYQKLQEEIMSELIKAIKAFESSVLKCASSAGTEFLFRLINRPAHFNRPHIFTTNYDRLVEHICEQLHIRIIDRFVGTLSPKFSSDPLNINYHYTPPGIKGEPRYLEQVIHYTKLHGSLDWYEQGEWISRITHPFGQESTGGDTDNASKVLIYPKASKSIETLLFPYSELFRDFQHGICRHNSLLITYGYSFGDSHINSIIESMLRIPSTHLLIITRDNNEAITKFQTKNNVSWMIGEEFTDFSTLNSFILPAPTIYKHLQRAYKLQALLSPKESEKGTNSDQ
ncbi:MAG: SIR2 family protein [Brevinema sp.]